MMPEKPQPPTELTERGDTLRIALVRHGETFQNRGHVVQGQDPTYGRLTEAGIRQAALVGEALAQRPFDVVYCSPLERAVLTMGMILVPRPGDRTLPLVFADQLREIHQGMLHGRPHSERKAAMDGQALMTFQSPGLASWFALQTRGPRYFQQPILPSAHPEAASVPH